MKVRENYNVSIVEVDEHTVEMFVSIVTDGKVRMRQEFNIAKQPGETAEEVCMRTYPYAFEDAQDTHSNATPTPIAPDVTSPDDSVDPNPVLREI